MLTILKGLPLSYFKDLQNDKELVFKSFDQLKNSLTILNDILKNFSVDKKRMLELAENGHLTATDLADYLAKQGVPFREAHEIVGKIVALAISKKKSLHELDLQDYRSIHPDIDEKIISVASLQSSVQSKNTFGGTSTNEVKKQIDAARKLLA